MAGQNLVTKIEVLSEQSTLVDVESILKEMLSDKASYNRWCDHLEIAANAGRYDAEEMLNLAKSRQLPSDLLVAFFIFVRDTRMHAAATLAPSTFFSSYKRPYYRGITRHTFCSVV